VPSDAERLATIEQIVRELRGDIQDRIHEEGRTRDRLHKIEGLVGMMVEHEKLSRRDTETRQRRLELRMQMLAAAVAIAALLEPFLYHFAQK
jgi:hypothetical protein